MVNAFTSSIVIGLLLGFGMVAWLRPNTPEGAVVSILIPCFMCMAVGTIISRLKG